MNNKRKKEPVVNNKNARGAKRKRNSFKDEPINFDLYTDTSEPFDMEFLEPVLPPKLGGEEEEEMSSEDDSSTISINSVQEEEEPINSNDPTVDFNKQPKIDFNEPSTSNRPKIDFNEPSTSNRPTIDFNKPSTSNRPTIDFNKPTISINNNNNNNNNNKVPSLQVEKSILNDMKTVISDSKLRQDEITKITHKYYGAYFLKTVKEMDVFKDIMDEETIGNDFYKAFVYAKTAINCNMQINKYNALASTMRVIFNLLSQAVHNHVVVNVLGRCVDSESLQNAFVEFQRVFMKESEVDKNQCISYIIQQEIDNDKPIRVPHPLVSCTTAQILGMSKYLTVILTSVAKGYIKVKKN